MSSQERVGNSCCADDRHLTTIDESSLIIEGIGSELDFAQAQRIVFAALLNHVSLRSREVGYSPWLTVDRDTQVEKRHMAGGAMFHQS